MDELKLRKEKFRIPIKFTHQNSTQRFNLKEKKIDQKSFLGLQEGGGWK